VACGRWQSDGPCYSLNYLKQYPLKKCDTISNDDEKKIRVSVQRVESCSRFSSRSCSCSWASSWLWSCSWFLDVSLRLKLGPGPDRCLSASQIHGRRSDVYCSYHRKWPTPLPPPTPSSCHIMYVNSNNKSNNNKGCYQGNRTAEQRERERAELPSNNNVIDRDRSYDVCVCSSQAAKPDFKSGPILRSLIAQKVGKNNKQ